MFKGDMVGLSPKMGRLSMSFFSWDYPTNEESKKLLGTSSTVEVSRYTQFCKSDDVLGTRDTVINVGRIETINLETLVSKVQITTL